MRPGRSRGSRNAEPGLFVLPGLGGGRFFRWSRRSAPLGPSALPLPSPGYNPLRCQEYSFKTISYLGCHFATPGFTQNFHDGYILDGLAARLIAGQPLFRLVIVLYEDYIPMVGYDRPEADDAP